MVYKKTKKSYRKKKRYNKQSFAKAVRNIIIKNSEKKSAQVSISNVTLPTYDPLVNSFHAQDLIKMAQGDASFERIGMSIRALSLDVRMTFEMIPPTTSTLAPTFCRYFIIKWPQKNTSATAQDAAFFLKNQLANGSSPSFGDLYNSGWNNDPNVGYKVLKSGMLTLTDKTETMLKIVNCRFNLNSLDIDFGSYASSLSPPQNSIGLYVINKSPHIQFSCTSTVVYTDL